MKNLYLCFFIIPILTSCITDFRPDDKFLSSFERKVVVNSIINPDSAIRVQVYWSKYIYDKGAIERINGAKVFVSEDGYSVFEGVTVEGLLQSDFYPKSGSKYSLRVVVEGEKEITASTTIPQRGSIMFKNRVNYAKHGTYLLFDASSLTIPVNTRAIWIRGAEEYDKGYIYSLPEFYVNNAFLDPINTAADATDAYARESNLIYEKGFIRIPGANVGKITPFTFSTRVNGKRSIYDPDYDPDDESTWKYIEITAKYASIYIITPSEEFDKYTRSAFMQNITLGNEVPLGGEAQFVFSNIENGLGVFAGYNLATFSVDSKIYLKDTEE